jgi:hypothetical protein
MRALGVCIVLLVLVVEASAARSPTSRERADIVLAMVTHFQRDNPLILVRVDRIRVSTVRLGPDATFTRFAIAVGLGRTTLLGYYPSSRRWFVKAHGSRRAVCRTSPFIFAGRRAAILRDLGIECG